MVYLASFGAENVGTGQFCVYGLLPAKDALKAAVPSGVKAAILNGLLTLTWDAAPGARDYRVLRTSTLEPGPKLMAVGLTTGKFTEPAPERGESATYRIIAVGTNGVSEKSEAVKVTSPKPKQIED